MKTLIGFIASMGDWLVSLSDRAKRQLVLTVLLLLIGGGTYKLTFSLKRLMAPQPVASPGQLIKPMEGLVNQTQDNVNAYRQARRRDVSRLDSLVENADSNKKTTDE